MAERPLPPYDLETEEALIGSLLLDCSQFLPIADVIGEGGEALWFQSHRWIFQTIRNLYLRQDPVDPITVATELKKHGKLEELGGPSELTRLLGSSIGAYHATTYAHTIARLYESRQVIEAGQRIVAAAYNPKTHSAVELARAELGKIKPAQYPTEELARRTSWTHAELMAAAFPDPEWVVEELLAKGTLVVLGGKQKLGKSWLCLQLAQAVASQGVFLGLEVKQGPVLYLALEDGAQRLKDRLGKQHAQGDLPIQYRFEFPKLNGPLGIERLASEIHDLGALLVVIDTLASAKTGDLDENDAGEMSALCNPLRQVAQAEGCTILLVHHHGKGAFGDPGVDLRGSSALAAAADANLGLYKKRNEAVATLMVESRDLPEHDWRLEFDPVDTFCWHLLGDAREIAASENEEDTLETLMALGEGTAGDIAKEQGKARVNARRILERLAAKGLVQRDSVKRGNATAVLYKPV